MPLAGAVEVAPQRMHELKRRLARSLAKNLPDAKALLTGRMPAFVTHYRARPESEVPVFVFHEVEPDRFEAQLRYLRDNGYVTLSAAELEAAARGECQPARAVALTFDDASSTFWSYAFPLLRRYAAHAILFVVPGLVPDERTRYPSLTDVWAGTASLASVALRRSTQPLCTWQELRSMHASGLVDIESHSMSHARVPVSPRIVDYVHPGLDTYLFGHVDVPLSSRDPRDPGARDLRLGAPVFESAPRLTSRTRFLEKRELVNALLNHVDSHGEQFFARPSWRRELMAIAKRWPRSERGHFETAADREIAMAHELVESKRQLEQRLGKQIRHFCYPWFSGSAAADRLAAQSGYRCLYYGIDTHARVSRTEDLVWIRRVSERYLGCLPGHGRLSLGRTLANELLQRIERAGGSDTSSQTTSSSRGLRRLGRLAAREGIGKFGARHS